MLFALQESSKALSGKEAAGMQYGYFDEKAREYVITNPKKIADQIRRVPKYRTVL